MASCTAEPSEAWVTQQARNLGWKLEDEGIKLGCGVSRPRQEVRA
jgi:hypothetical protein